MARLARGWPGDASWWGAKLKRSFILLSHMGAKGVFVASD